MVRLLLLSITAGCWSSYYFYRLGLRNGIRICQRHPVVGVSYLTTGKKPR